MGSSLHIVWRVWNELIACNEAWETRYGVHRWMTRLSIINSKYRRQDCSKISPDLTLLSSLLFLLTWQLAYFRRNKKKNREEKSASILSIVQYTDKTTDNKCFILALWYPCFKERKVEKLREKKGKKRQVKDRRYN